MCCIAVQENHYHVEFYGSLIQRAFNLFVVRCSPHQVSSSCCH